MRRFLIVSFLVWLTACGENPPACAIPTASTAPQDCSALSHATWQIGPFATPSQPDFLLGVGESRTLWLTPFVEAECKPTIASVTWLVDNPSVAFVTPKVGAADYGSWITGATPGTATVSARVAFSEGSVQHAQAKAIHVVPFTPPPGSLLITEGTVTVEAPATSPGAGRAFVTFTIPLSGQVDVRIDWTSLVNRLDFSVYQGACSTVPCPGMIVMTTRVTDVKPLPASNDLPAGAYTIRIDNLGPGAETVRYEVRLTPK